MFKETSGLLLQRLTSEHSLSPGQCGKEGGTPVGNSEGSFFGPGPGLGLPQMPCPFLLVTHPEGKVLLFIVPGSVELNHR